MKVFVTGSTGFLGQAVTRVFVEAGHDVTAMVRSSRHRLDDGVIPVESDLSSVDQLAKILKGIDVVVHLAGKVSRDPQDGPEMHDIHVNGTRVLLQAMEQAKVRKLILSSTSGTIAVSKESGYIATEVDTAPIELIGRWPYYMSKFLQEKEVLSWDAQDKVESVILNPSLLLGPGDERLSSTGDVLKILEGRLPAITKGTVAFVDVRDCASAFLSALEQGKRGHRYLLNGVNLSVSSFVERVARAGDVPMPLFKLPSRFAKLSSKFIEGAYQAMDRIPPVDSVSVEMGCYHWGCSWSKAESELDFCPRDPQQTVNDTVQDLANRGIFRKL